MRACIFVPTAKRGVLIENSYLQIRKVMLICRRGGTRTVLEAKIADPSVLNFLASQEPEC